MANPHENTLANSHLPEIRCPLCNALLARTQFTDGIFSTQCQRCGTSRKAIVVVLVEIRPKEKGEGQGQAPP